MRISEPYTLFPRTLKSGKVVYYYQFRDDSKRRSAAKSTGCTTLSSARRFCQKLYNSGAFETQSTISFENFSKDFFSKNNDFYKWKKVNNSTITDNTILRYNGLLKYQLLPYFAKTKITEIRRADIKEWIIWASDKWASKTVNNAQTVLNLILKSAVEKDIIKFNPADNIGFRKTEKLDRNTYTIKELNIIYHSDLWSHEYLRNAFLLIAITGMRVNEVSCLTDSDIKSDYIYISHHWHKKFGMCDSSKTKMNRIVPIPCDFKFPEHQGYIYGNEKPFDSCRLRDNIERICIELGLDYKNRHLSTHSLRAFYNTYLESKNITDAKVKAIIGHKDKTMTGLYTFWKPDMFSDIHEVQNELYKEIVCQE